MRTPLFLSLLAAASAHLNAFGAMKRMEPDVLELKDSHAALWSLDSEDAAPAEPISIHLHFAHSEETKKVLHQALMAVSDPKSALYGKHLNNNELAEIVGAHPDALALVSDWLFSNGLSADDVELNPTKDVLHVKSHVAIVESMLNTDIKAYVHEKSSVRLLRAATAYHLPEKVAEVINIVGDIARLPAIRETVKGFKNPTYLRKPSSTAVVDLFVALGRGDKVTDDAAPVGGSGLWANDCSIASCKGLVTPGVIRTRYNIEETSANAAGNNMAVAEFQQQYYDPKSISLFQNDCHVDSTPATTIGGNVPSEQGIEAILDIEFIKVSAPEVPLTVWYASDYSLLNWATAVNDMAQPIWVWSVSYGNDEAQQTSAAYMEQCSTQFQKAGLKGISLLFASGDQGTCGREGCGFFFKKYHPDFPAANPYITAVGGTDFLGNNIGEETTWTDGGGGFSNTFGIPEWQTEVVAQYKASATLPSASYFNNTGRGYPDIAALGGQKNPYCIAVSSSSFEGVAGTSASCPVAAGIFAKLNGIRLAAGKPTLGFLNPFIYQHPEAFNDVTTGNNGFAATKGWDPATGFGTPNYEALAKIVAALP